MKFRWHIAPAQPLLCDKLAGDLNLTTLLVQCLLNRGFSEPEQIRHFLDPKLRRLADPFLIPNMAVAVDRLLLAHELGERVVIFGDYDVDGVTSTALLREFLTRLGWLVDHYLPHRMDEGYGLSQEGVENCLRKFPAKLLLAVDCGSTAVQSIAWLRERGVEVIVLDHHQVSAPAPAAVALVNPQLAKGGEKDASRTTQPATCFTELCSVGLAFKLAHAILKRGRETGLPGAHEFDLRPLLDLVALGTIADIVPLRGENRILVGVGLEWLNKTQRPGLLALKEVAQSPEIMESFDVGYQLAPRLNAAGRLETAEEALFLLLAQDADEAMPIAQRLDAQNRERQKIERGIAEAAIGAVKARFNPETDYVIVEGQLMWHIGVVGIVASRVLSQFYRPTIIVGGDGDNWRGSGRSIAGFDLAAALRECDDLLVRHGGHAMAAGLTIHPDKLDAFRARINEVARRSLKREDLQPPLRLDAEVRLAQISMGGMADLARLHPVGQENPPVQFFARNLTHARPLQRVGKDRQHVKLWVTDGRTTHECVWWNAGEGALPVGTFDLAFAPQLNHFNGHTGIQLKVLDWRAAG
jgi:single-stranded-DNA-specific exonuclease